MFAPNDTHLETITKSHSDSYKPEFIDNHFDKTFLVSYDWKRYELTKNYRKFGELYNNQ